jgi:predicted Rossmann fold flavoprotein
MKVGIIGGGPAGFAAAIELGREGIGPIVLERTESVLNKFVLSGGGRCNITNTNLSEEYYNGDSKNFIKNVLKAFSCDNMLELLRKMGIKYIIEKDGRVYTGDAKETAYRLLNYATGLGTSIVYKAFVEKIEKKGEQFLLRYKGREEIFDRIILATGGKSYPETGSDGFGYVMAESLGHSIVHPLPALTPLFLSDNPFKDLMGITVNVEISVVNDNLKFRGKRYGSLLFTHNGITGPAVMNISGDYVRYSRERGTFLFVNFLPNFKVGDFEERIKGEAATSGRKKVVNFLKNFFPDRLAMRLLALSGVDSDRMLCELSKDERKRLLNTLFSCQLKVRGSPGFKVAHITSGGIPLEEVKANTMESKIVKGLFFAGEVLNADGCEGGYNLHWAFATGTIAARGILK